MKVLRNVKAMKKYLLYGVILCSLLFIYSYSFAATSCESYQAVPPFLVQDIPPNVLFVLDTSGSMGWLAYQEVVGETCSNDRAITGYNQGKEYYGLFNSDRTYQYNNSNGKHFFEPIGNVVDDITTVGVTERAACLRTATNNLWSGNWLNWFTTRRIDAARKVLTGGRVAPDTDDMVLEGSPGSVYSGYPASENRRLYNDCAVGDGTAGLNNCVEAGIEANKNVYYTPFHQGIYAYFDDVTRDDMGGTSSQEGMSVEISKATFNDADELAGIDCVTTGTDLSQNATIFPVATTRGTDSSYLDDNGDDAFLVAVNVHDDDLPIFGVIQNMAAEVRFGYMGFNDNGDAGTVRIPIADLINEERIDKQGNIVDDPDDDPETTVDPHGDTVFTIVDTINQHRANGGTPLAEVLFEAGQYFKQYDPGTSSDITPLFAGDFDIGLDTSVDPNVSWDPYYFRDADNYDGTYGAYVPCAKSFIIYISDGAATSDNEVPASTDITFRGDGDNNLDDIAFTLHTTDIRGDDETSIFAESKNVDQNITLYTVYAFDTSVGAQAQMMLAARAGGFIDLNNDGDVGNSTNLGGTVSSTDPSAFESTRNGEQDVEWDANDDDIPDTYFEATDGAELETAIASALEDIIRRTASGSSLSVLSDRSTTGSVLHQALFFPNQTYDDNYSADWIGTLNAYWFYVSNNSSSIREDNVEGFFLNEQFDYTLDFKITDFGDLNIDYYTNDVDGNPDINLGTYASVTDVHKIFDTGSKLRDKAAGNRVIYAYDDDGLIQSFISTAYSSFDNNLGLNLTTPDFPSCLGTTDQAKAENLINYTRGAADDFTSATGSACRSREVRSQGGDNDGEGYRWKLGDIIHSSPTLIDYNTRSVIYVASNDGMLHAFESGKLREDGIPFATNNDQKVRLCKEKGVNPSICNTDDIGEELWAFIPQNVMPYLKYIPNPDYRHIYTHDMAPYFIKHGGKKIIVGGMRMGGGAGCVYKGDSCGDPADNVQVLPPEFDGANPTTALGLSSYYAIDVTDPDKPLFLWEFNNPDLGLTYSGPAFIERGGDGYVMFLSGPLNYKGETNGDAAPSVTDAQGLSAYILKVDNDFNLVDTDEDGDVDSDDVYKISDDSSRAGWAYSGEFQSANNAFGGRMFTTGIDADNDGNTDAIFFGVNDANGTDGTVMLLAPFDGANLDGSINHDPTNKNEASGGTEDMNWYFVSVVESTGFPVVTKVITGECFEYPFIYFGTGRWFYKGDSPGSSPELKPERLYGILISDCLADIAAGKKCSLNFAHATNDICGELETIDKETTMGWIVEDLEAIGGGYMKERTTTDPTFDANSDIVFFTTMQPSAKICDFGGRSRMWALNCMTGDSIWAECPGGNYGFTIDDPEGSLLLQLSGGNIEGADLDQSDFSEEGNKATEWFVGVPPESATPFVPPGSTGFSSGEIILWIER